MAEVDAAEVGAENGPESLAARVAGCRACPRLVSWRESVAEEKRAAFANDSYWGRGVPGFGDPQARIVIVGLAPAAHGANRTGRIFTGDRSGDWLFASLYRVGLANQPESVACDDGLMLHDVWVTAAVKCAPPANKPTTGERNTCVDSFLIKELGLLSKRAVTVCLGKFAYDVVSACQKLAQRPAFGHGVKVTADDGQHVLCSYHPSQQNTFTRKLTEPMLDSVFLRAIELASTPAT